jgi:folate-dependent phosphoribosylglycinamide formyltransferase PurN
VRFGELVIATGRVFLDDGIATPPETSHSCRRFRRSDSEAPVLREGSDPKRVPVMTARIVLMAGPGMYTPIVYNALRSEFPDLHVLLDGPLSRLQIARRRIRKQGWFTVAGQMGFKSAVFPVLRWLGRKRIAEIMNSARLEAAPITAPVIQLDSVNSNAAREHLSRLKPDVVVVSGTRILSKRTLRSIPAPFINIHMGISPAFRGVHGAYWALSMGRPELAGTTIHFVDAGIDTGPILKQATFAVTPRDSFATYPYLHLAAGIPLLKQAIREVLAGSPSVCKIECDLPSTLRFQPTAWHYLFRRVFSGLR